MIRTTRAVFQALWSARFRAAFAVLLTSGMLFAAVDSKACASPTGKASAAHKMPFQEPSNDTYDPTIVGLWHTMYTITGAPPAQSLFLESLKMWHRDGTEFENAVLPPTGGNVCVGVWKEVGPRTVKLHHTGLMFDTTDLATNALVATFTVDETDTVALDGKTYTGCFTFKQYDLDGNLKVTISGTIAATRISVD